MTESAAPQEPAEDPSRSEERAPARFSQDDPWIGRMVDRYLVERVLGQGGMGQVYVARHVDLNRTAAVKILRADQVPDAARARFRREMALMAGVNHPNVATVYDG